MTVDAADRGITWAVARIIEPNAFDEEYAARDIYPDQKMWTERTKANALVRADVIIALVRGEAAAATPIERRTPTEQQLSNIARAIGATMRLTNHLERAKEVWAAIWMEGEHPIPEANPKATP